MRDAASFEDRIRTNPDVLIPSETEADPVVKTETIPEPTLDLELVDFVFTNLANDSDSSIRLHRERITVIEDLVGQLQGWQNFFRTIKNPEGFIEGAELFLSLVNEHAEHTRAFSAAATQIEQTIHEPKYDSLAWQVAELLRIINSVALPGLHTSLQYHAEEMDSASEASDLRTSIKIREDFISNELLLSLDALPPNSPERGHIEARINSLRQDIAHEKEQLVTKKLKRSLPANMSITNALNRLEFNQARRDTLINPEPFIERTKDKYIEVKPERELSAKQKLQQRLDLWMLDNDIRDLKNFVIQTDVRILDDLKKRFVEHTPTVDVMNKAIADEAEAKANRDAKRTRPTQNLRRVGPFSKAA